jgi:hypothetical protein
MVIFFNAEGGELAQSGAECFFVYLEVNEKIRVEESQHDCWEILSKNRK